MKLAAALAAVAFIVSAGSASACEWNKTAQSVKAPDETKVASIAAPQSAPVKK